MDNSRYDEARKRVKELKEFYGHLLVYVSVNLLLITINLVTRPEALWFHWATIFWGIAVAFHGVNVFWFKGRIMNTEWEERKIRELMEKERAV